MVINVPISLRKIKGKRLLFAVLVASMTVGIVVTGCGSSNAPSKTSSTQNQASGQNGMIAYANKSLGYYFFVAQQTSLQKAAEADGYTFQAVNADMDSATQYNQFVNFIANKPKAIVSDPIDSEGLIGAITKANAAGIPVAIIDTPTTGGKVAITVAFDNKLAGEMQAKEVVKLLTVKYGQPKGIVFDGYGAMSSWAWRLRKEGFDAIMQKYPNIKVLEVPTDGDVTKEHDGLINSLAQYPNIDAVCAPSDTPGDGLYEALKDKGLLYKVGNPKHVIIVTIDGEPMGIQRIEAGYYDADVAQDGLSYGEIAMELMTKYTFKGQPVPLGTYTNDQYYWKSCPIISSPSGPYVEVPPYVITKDNASDPKNWGNIAYNNWGIKYH